MFPELRVIHPCTTLIGAVAAGRPAASPAVRRRGPRANAELTSRELDVLAQLATGRTNEQIGHELSISPKTVMHHTMSVYRKLSVSGRSEAAVLAVRTGLIAA